jgi:hypothetical protein
MTGVIDRLPLYSFLRPDFGVNQVLGGILQFHSDALAVFYGYKLRQTRLRIFVAVSSRHAPPSLIPAASTNSSFRGRLHGPKAHVSASAPSESDFRGCQLPETALRFPPQLATPTLRHLLSGNSSGDARARSLLAKDGI